MLKISIDNKELFGTLYFLVILNYLHSDEKYKINDFLNTKRLEKNILQSLSMQWSKELRCWENKQYLSMLNIEFSDEYISKNDSSKPVATVNSVPNPLPFKVLKVKRGINIDSISEVQLACTILGKDEEINVTPSDAETLLKNMVAIQSKLNELVKAFNKIATVLSDDQK